MNIPLLAVATFCTIWNTGSVQSKNGFLLGPLPKLKASMKEKGLQQGSIDVFAVCFETNLSTLRETLDKDCKVEKALSDFFGAPVDTSDQEYEHITEYINMCTNPEGQET